MLKYLLIAVAIASAHGQGLRSAFAAQPMSPMQPAVADRFADGTLGLMFGLGSERSGCGIHKTCYQCGAQPGCGWVPSSGCIQSNLPSFCGLADDTTIAQTCPEINSCHDCTGQSGCVWWRGQCQYSRGQGCLSDPINCVNFQYQCPAPTTTPAATTPAATTPAPTPTPAPGFGLAELSLLGQLTQGLGSQYPSYSSPYAYPAPFAGPSYGVPSYGVPAYGVPAYGVPSYGTRFAAPSYGTPAFGRPLGRPLGRPAFTPYTRGGNTALGPALANLNVGGTGGLHGLGMFDNIDVGLASGLLVPSLNVHATTNNATTNLLTGQSLGCRYGDLYCNSAALDPYAPSNLNAAYDVLDAIGLPFNEQQYPAYNVPAPFTAPSFQNDFNANFGRPIRPQPRFRPQIGFGFGG